MVSSYLPAIAALAGSAVGGITSLVAAWLVHRRQVIAQHLENEKTERQALYKSFMQEASKLYADALAHDESELSALVGVFALIGAMRIVSSDAVVQKAEAVVHNIMETYFVPNRTFVDLRELAGSHVFDPLREFSETCREELKTLTRV